MRMAGPDIGDLGFEIRHCELSLHHWPHLLPEL